MPSLEDSPEIEDIFYPPALEDLVYDRALTIATITDYYTFLTKMYMKESQIIHPPPQGWPTIINANPVLLKSLNKSEEVLSLLAHLPYIRTFDNDHSDADGACDCLFADWQYLLREDTASFYSPEMRGENLLILTEKN